MSQGNWKRRHAAVANDTGVIGRRGEGSTGSASLGHFLGLGLRLRCFFAHALSLGIIVRWMLTNEKRSVGRWPVKVPRPGHTAKISEAERVDLFKSDGFGFLHTYTEP